jgi:hypothetical protein
MNKLFATAAAALFASSLGGCATVTRGTTNQIQIDSEPAGALARTSLNHTCTTPCTIQVSRKDEFTVTFSKPGFTDERVEVKTQIAGAGAAGFAGNVILGGVVGMGVDAATGATYEHVPNPVRAVLQPERPAAAPPAVRNRRGRPVS